VVVRRANPRLAAALDEHPAAAAEGLRVLLRSGGAPLPRLQRRVRARLGRHRLQRPLGSSTSTRTPGPSSRCRVRSRRDSATSAAATTRSGTGSSSSTATSGRWTSRAEAGRISRRRARRGRRSSELCAAITTERRPPDRHGDGRDLRVQLRTSAWQNLYTSGTKPPSTIEVGGIVDPVRRVFVIAVRQFDSRAWSRPGRAAWTQLRRRPTRRTGTATAWSTTRSTETPSSGRRGYRDALEQRHVPTDVWQLSLGSSPPAASSTPPPPRRPRARPRSFARIDFTPAGAPVASGLPGTGRRLQRERGLRWNVTTGTIARTATPISGLDTFAWVDNTSTRAWRYDLPDGDYLVSFACGDQVYSRAIASRSRGRSP